MSQTKLKPPAIPLASMIRSRGPSGAFIPWRLGSPKAGESARWECVDGRWAELRWTTGGGRHLRGCLIWPPSRVAVGDKSFLHFASPGHLASALLICSSGFLVHMMRVSSCGSR